eukprot:scaffold314_cov562-Prasinococcus_capsulatus_cf.AAC.4
MLKSSSGMKPGQKAFRATYGAAALSSLDQLPVTHQSMLRVQAGWRCPQPIPACTQYLRNSYTAEAPPPVQATMLPALIPQTR